MGTAKQHDGRSIVAYVGDKAVDSEGEEIKGAPKPPKNTDPADQPAMSNLTPEQRMGLEIARAVADPKGTLKAAGASKTSAKAADEEDDASTTRLPAPPRGAPGNAAAASAPSASGAENESGADAEPPKIGELEAHLAGLKTADQVKALQRRDKRVGARKLYKARLEELKGE